MTADEAKQALKEGKEVQHKGWVEKGFLLYDSFETYMKFGDYKDDDWEIVE